MPALVSDLASLLRDILAADNEELITDYLVFRGTVPTSTTAVTQPTIVNTRQTHDHFVTRIHMGATTPLTNPADLDLIRWNIEVSGTARNMFKNDVELAAHVSQISVLPIDFSPGGYAFRAGADLSMTITRRSAVTTERIVTIGLVCILVPKGRLERYLGHLAGPSGPRA